ncbi:MAG TPA: PQQ-dependent sugar dehydrogenase [Candidatus Binatia bacterium]|nr:PQQ-dependent sugar dehydrogenase [Candidatus Binatia bacterium]
MKNVLLRISSLALALSLWPALATAADPDDRCAGGKLKAAGNYGKQLLTCESTALRQDVPVSSECTARALEKLQSGFERAESRGGCATTGDAGAVADMVEADVAAVAASMIYDDDASRLCAAAKLAAAGKHYAARMNCYAKAAKRGADLDAACGTKADDKLQTSFTKLETSGGCGVDGDWDEVGDQNTDNVIEIVAAVSPLCGDDVAGPGQPCDGSDDDSCPGLCTGACICNTPPACGNGAAELPEECDDGGNVDFDGCSAACVLENASALCDGVTSSSGTALDAELVAAVDQPIHMAAPPLDPSRLFVVERPGRIRIVDLDGDVLLTTPYLDITGKVSENGEQGLLSMAFHPDFEDNGWFFVNYTNNAGDTVIARYEAADPDDDTVAASSERILIVIDQPFSNHNGGQIAFGSDGYLYTAMGDGGGGGDPLETAQNDGSLLGKILRFDVDVENAPYYAVPTDNPGYVDGSDPLELIWAKGLRNPWRFSFDRSTGDLLLADVGQGSWEEINYQSVGSGGGENYGWDIFEADMCFEPDPAPECPDPATGFTFPIHEYSHNDGSCSVSGGFVYRGCSMPDLTGTYFYSDYCSAFVRTFVVNGGSPTNHDDVTSDLTPVGASVNSVVSFGEDARGELYIADIGGQVFRIIRATP